MLAPECFDSDLTSVRSQVSAWILVILNAKLTTLTESLLGCLGTSWRCTFS